MIVVSEKRMERVVRAAEFLHKKLEEADQEKLAKVAERLLSNLDKIDDPFVYFVAGSLSQLKYYARDKMVYFGCHGMNWGLNFSTKEQKWWLIEEGTEQNDWYEELPKWILDEVSGGLLLKIR